MLQFPENLYSDIRIEDVYETSVLYEKGTLLEHRVRETLGAFLRVFDGKLWHTAATSDTSQRGLERALADLAERAVRNEGIHGHPVVKAFQVKKDRQLRYAKLSVKNVSGDAKQNFLRKHFSVFEEFKSVTNWSALYRDRHVTKKILSSQGTDLEFDTQYAGWNFSAQLTSGDHRFFDSDNHATDTFEDLEPCPERLRSFLLSCQSFTEKASPIDPGSYTVLLSPPAAGIFAHESFGHKSEADFMLGDPDMLREWEIGKRIGPDFLSIVDSGVDGGLGEFPYDDEGNPTERTFLIENGRLTGRLHSAQTAGELGEPATGNARALDYEFEPIPRMRTTYFMAGTRSFEDILASISEGIFVESTRSGTGMSTFTITPARAWKIEQGAITRPVRFSVMSGNVMQTLGDIEAVSSDVQILSSVRGGCGKGEQYPLPVSFGGPYVLVKNMRIN